MNAVITQKDAEEFVRTGAKEFSLSPGMLLTPSARDVFTTHHVQIIPSALKEDKDAVSASPSIHPFKAEELFRCEEAERVKQEICDIGRRLWQREYVDGNGGNISYRLTENAFLCTPTRVSKGFMKPDSLCLVDIEGRQLAGKAQRTSEITTHLAVYRGEPKAKAVVHAHPVHATAFAIAGVEPPPCLIPELEVFVGRVPVAPYKTPGSAEMAAIIEPMAPQHQSILMGNHGVLCWGDSVEDAYFKMEITDAYCRTLIVAAHLNPSHSGIPQDKMRDLLEMKKKMGLPDARYNLETVKLCEIDPWEVLSGKASRYSSHDSREKVTEIPEDLVQQITDQVMRALSQG